MKHIFTTALMTALCLTASAQGIETASSFAPRVKASYIPRGVDFALGRITVNGKKIAQQGFCYSDTNPQPTLADSVTYDNTWTHNGTIYRIEGLKPATIYYIRAYAINEAGDVGYSPVQKICTLFESNATYVYDFGADAAANKRIDEATAEAIRYYHKATNFQGYDVEVTYNAGVPTADCYYGGHIRVGANPSYQATGTLLHEMNHGVGVGQHWRWMSNADLRSNVTTGNWLGTRANKVVQFFDNDDASVLKGDNQHMWPYGINGAHEDTHSEILYTANIMITQALAEDGLPPTYDMGNGAPSMVFDPLDDQVYYIKSECKGLGFENGFLADHDKNIVWVEDTSDKILEDKNCAWRITFDPATSRYSFQNVGTGNYLCVEDREKDGYINDFIVLNSRTELKDKDRFQLLGSRKNVKVGDKFSMQSFWLFYPRTGGYMGYDPTLQAEEGGATQSTTYFEFGNKNTNQRWLFMTEKDVKLFDEAMGRGGDDRLSEVISACSNILAVPHTDNTGEADEAFEATINMAEQYHQNPVDSISSGDVIQTLYEAIGDFIANTSITDVNKPYDITILLSNPDLAEGTTNWSETPTYAAGICEYYSEKYSFNQKLPIRLPIGHYSVSVQGFQRPGTLDKFATAITNASVVLGTKSQKLMNILDGASDQPLNDSDILVDGKYIPNTMAGAAAYIESGAYDNVLYTELTSTTSALFNVGVKCTSTLSDYWTCFKGFSIKCYCDKDPVEATGITAPEYAGHAARNAARMGIYTMSGTLVSRDADDLESLPRGMYIVNGRKVMK